MKVLVRELLVVGLPVFVVLMVDFHPFSWSVAAGLLGCAALPLRLRWPWLAALLSLPAVAGGLGWAGALVSQYRIGRTERSVPVMASWVAALTVASVTPVIITETLPLGTLLIAAAFEFGLAGVPTALGALVTTRKELTASLLELRRARAAEMEAQEASARAAERTRIAREIHDAVGHHATLIAVEAAALAATTTDQETRDTANRLRGLAKESLAEMRTALGMLNSPRLPYQSVPELVERARAAGLPVRFEDRGVSVTPAVGRALFRVIQEALTNVTKHAPGAAVLVTLDSKDSEVHVSVVNGAPSSGPVQAYDSGGLGLHGLSERVRMAGGTLRTSHRPDGGFTVEAVLPAGTAKVDQDDSTFGGSARDAANA